MKKLKFTIALAALVVSTAFAISRYADEHRRIRAADLEDVWQGEISEMALKSIYVEEDPELVTYRNKLKNQYLVEAVERRSWDKEIAGGLRCWFCKGPHPWSWCNNNPVAQKAYLEIVVK